jgi:hypothetical protein
MGNRAVDILDFLAHSEWPAVATIALWLLRRPLVRMADRVSPTKLDAWGLKAEFAEVLDKVEGLIPTTTPPVSTTPLPPAIGPEAPAVVPAPASAPMPTQDAPTGQWALPPVPSILADWMRLTSTIRELADQARRNAGKPWIRSPPIEDAAGELGLTDDELAALRELQTMRNDIAHSKSVTVSLVDAIRFRSATDELLARLDKIAARQKHDARLAEQNVTE